MHSSHGCMGGFRFPCGGRLIPSALIANNALLNLRRAGCRRARATAVPVLHTTAQLPGHILVGFTCD